MVSRLTFGLAVIFSLAAYCADAATYFLCSSTQSCPSQYGLACTYNSPCSKGWCNRCVSDEYLTTFNIDNIFICVKPTHLIGETGCSLDTDCYDKESYCDKNASPNTCKCLTGFIASSDGKKCNSLGTVSVGSVCSNVHQCGENTICSLSGLCQCTANHRSQDGTNCVPYVTGDSCPPSYCSPSSNCPGATCSTGTYQCLSGYMWVSQIQVGWADSIENHGSCVPNSAILNKELGATCTESWPYTQVCRSGLLCHQCAENSLANYECVNPAADPCLSNPCLNGGTCLNYDFYYSCNCRHENTGARCQNTAGQSIWNFKQAVTAILMSTVFYFMVTSSVI